MSGDAPTPTRWDGPGDGWTELRRMQMMSGLGFPSKLPDREYIDVTVGNDGEHRRWIRNPEPDSLDEINDAIREIEVLYTNPLAGFGAQDIAEHLHALGYRLPRRDERDDLRPSDL